MQKYTLRAGGITEPADFINATADLLEGKEVRFARIRHDGIQWHHLNTVRLRLIRETNPHRRAKGYGDMIRLHDGDGDPDGDGSHALPIYDVAKAHPTEIAVRLALYLTASAQTQRLN